MPFHEGDAGIRYVSSGPTVKGSPGPRKPRGRALAVAGVIGSGATPRPLSFGVLSVVLLALLAATGCASSSAPPSSAAAKRPVYVRDFLYDTSDAREHEERFIGGGEGPVRRVLQGRPISEDAVGRARRLAELLSNTIHFVTATHTQDLSKATVEENSFKDTVKCDQVA